MLRNEEDKLKKQYDEVISKINEIEQDNKGSDKGDDYVIRNKKTNENIYGGMTVRTTLLRFNEHIDAVFKILTRGYELSHLYMATEVAYHYPNIHKKKLTKNHIRDVFESITVTSKPLLKNDLETLEYKIIDIIKNKALLFDGKIHNTKKINGNRSVMSSNSKLSNFTGITKNTKPSGSSDPNSSYFTGSSGITGTYDPSG
jgi:predicted GIY-YIG superfamily endonuclease